MTIRQMGMRPLRKIPILFLFLMAVVLRPCAFAGNAPTLADLVRIADVEIQVLADGLSVAAWTELAGGLIRVRPGDVFSQEKLDQSLDALKKSRRFKEARALLEEGEEGLRVRFVLSPFPLIRDILIHGAYPLFRREIQNVMTVFVGGIYNPAEMDAQRTLIVEAYRREGFPNADVRMEALASPRDGNIDLHVHIQTGPSCYLEEMAISGNRFFSTVRLKVKMKTWQLGLLPRPAGRFTENQLRKDIQKLRNFYLSKGFAEASVEYMLLLDSEGRRASVSILVEEGPRYRFAFEIEDRPRAFRKGVLKEDVAHILQGRSFGRSAIRKAIKNIRARHRAAGYLETQVVVVEKDVIRRGTPEKKIVFRIQQGTRTRVGHVHIEGNRSLRDSLIRKQMLIRSDGFWRRAVPYNPDLLAEDKEAIRSLYLQNGFQDAQTQERVVFNADRTWTDIFLTIAENRRTLVAGVDFRGLGALSRQEALGIIRLKPGAPYHAYLIRNDENALSAAISEKGHPRAKVTGAVKVSADLREARIEFTVTEGPYMSMGGIYYSGNFRTKASVMQREAKMMPGEPFSLKSMLEAQRNIRNLDVFRSVKFQTVGLNEDWDTVHLFVDVEEKKPFYVETGWGFESNKGVYLQGMAGDNNLFGLNKKSWVAGEMSETGNRMETGYSDPRFLGTRTTANAGLYREAIKEFNQDFATETFGATVGFSRSLVSFLSAGLNFRYEDREQIPKGKTDLTDVYGDSFFDPRKILVSTPSIQWDNRDSFIRPRQGVYATLAVDISKGIRNSLDNFYKYRLDVRGYVPAAHRVTLAAKCTAGLVEPFKSTDLIPEDQLFFLGGTNDVRGFDENMLRMDQDGNSLGGALAISSNIEARIEISRSFEFTCFYDIGRVSDIYGDYTDSSFRDAAGGGMRYITPIGPVGLLYGHKLDRRPGESPGRVHFSFGYTF